MLYSSAHVWLQVLEVGNGSKSSKINILGHTCEHTDPVGLPKSKLQLNFLMLFFFKLPSSPPEILTYSQLGELLNLNAAL